MDVKIKAWSGGKEVVASLILSTKYLNSQQLYKNGRKSAMHTEHISILCSEFRQSSNKMLDMPALILKADGRL